VDPWQSDVVRHVDVDELLATASDLTRFKSWSDQERDCATWVADLLRRNGFDVELPEVEPGRPNVIGRLDGRRPGRNLMFNGHLDIDPLPDWYNHDPWQVEARDGRLWGHGLGNMKAGVASMLHAAIAVGRAGGPHTGSVTVACVVGELQSGIGTAHLVAAGTDADVAIVPEPSAMNVRTMHAAIFIALITVTGRSGWHGGTHRYKTVNAVDKMADVITGLRGLRIAQLDRPEFPDLPKLLVGGIRGGLGREATVNRPGYVPDRCTTIVEVRVTPGTDLDSVGDQIAEALAGLRRRDPDLDVELLPPPAPYEHPWRSGPVQHPGLYLPPDHPLPRLLADTHRDVTGAAPARIGMEDPGSYGCTDAGHLAAAGVRGVVYGPTANLFGESWVGIDTLATHSRVLAAAAARITASSPGLDLSEQGW
jgi:acetylornithine deacetylase/succinyl-diaminopimelate desuccinylase-like protein